MSTKTARPKGGRTKPVAQCARLARGQRDAVDSRAVVDALRTGETPPCFCFVCGGGVECGPLEGSGHSWDWVHAACLKQPYAWK